MSAIDNVLERLEHVRRTSSGWSARCPAHDDRNPSLGVAVGEDGKVLLNCLHGCSIKAVVGALGIEMRDLFDNHSSPTSVYVPKRHKRVSESSPRQLNREEIEGDFEDGVISQGEYMRLLGLWNAGMPDRFPRSRVEVEFDEYGEITHYELRQKAIGDVS